MSGGAVMDSNSHNFLFLGEHPALDFLNTVVRVGDEPVDFLQSDADVAAWLAEVGMEAEAKRRLSPGELLHAARSLRKLLRAVVESKKHGGPVDTRAWNVLLAKGHSRLGLRSLKGGALALERRWESRTAAEALAPLAEACADFLVHGDFDLVRECEDESCVLWFYDRTKSHRRRWCSAATCGNRNKVAAFRSRQQQAAQ